MSKLQTLLANVNGNTIIAIDTVTVPKLAGGQKNPMQGKVRKIMIGGNVMVFTNKNSNGYENMVNRRLAQEGKDPASFQLGERAWGKRIAGTPFVEHNGAMYLEVIFLKPGKVHYEHGVREISAAQVQGLQQKDEAEQGGLDNKVIIRTFKADSISSITIDGQRHVL
jgi:hypothetical protein